MARARTETPNGGTKIKNAAGGPCRGRSFLGLSQTLGKPECPQSRVQPLCEVLVSSALCCMPRAGPKPRAQCSGVPSGAEECEIKKQCNVQCGEEEGESHHP